jgi:HEAT repeat protein
MEILFRFARSPDWCFRRIAIEAIDSREIAPVTVCLIREALHDPSPFVVRTACEAVERWGLTEAYDDLLTLLNDREAATRQTAVRALSSVWRPEAFAPVLHMCRSDPAREVRREAAWTLRRAAEPAAWRELFDMWKEDELPRLRFWACELACEFGSSSVKGELETLTRDRDGHVRKAARRALEQALSSDAGEPGPLE